MSEVSYIAAARFKRDLEGREYSWFQFCIWLHDRKYNKNSREAKRLAAIERKRLNDRVLSNLGITPGKKLKNNKR